jgi:RNA polymerase sigma-54 factor
MEIKQQLRLSQQLVMTPQLQQAIKLLQMSRMELVDLVHEEMLENPVLEDVSEIGVPLDKPSTSGASVDNESRAEHEVRSLEAAAPGEMPVQSEASREAEKKTDEIDWDRYLENHALQAPMPGLRGSDQELPGLEATLTRGADLPGHLLWQMRLADFVDDEQRFAMLVFGNLTDDGYLKLEEVPPEEVVPRLAAEAGLDAEDAEEVLQLIQRFDPVGVASRDLRECLLVQARTFGLDQLVIDILDRHLGNLERKNYAAVAKDLRCTVEEVYDVAQVIAELEPRPGRNFITEEPQYITPDVYVRKIGDDYLVDANDDGMPKLKISGF